MSSEFCPGIEKLSSIAFMYQDLMLHLQPFSTLILTFITIGFQLFLFFPSFTFPFAYSSYLVIGSVGDNVEKSLNEVMTKKSTTRSSITDFWNDWMIFAARIHRFCDFTTSETRGNVYPDRWQGNNISAIIPRHFQSPVPTSSVQQECTQLSCNLTQRTIHKVNYCTGITPS